MIYVFLTLASLLFIGSLILNYAFIKLFMRIEVHESASGLLSQSEEYELAKMHDESFRETKEEDEKVVKLAIYDGIAYWVTDDGLMYAPVDEDDEVEYSLKRPVDAHAMTQGQIDMMLEILDALKEEQ